MLGGHQATGCSNALHGLRFTPGDGSSPILAEVFDDFEGSIEGDDATADYEIYPLDGKNMPLLVSLSPELVGMMTKDPEAALRIIGLRALSHYHNASTLTLRQVEDFRRKYCLEDAVNLLG